MRGGWGLKGDGALVDVQDVSRVPPSLSGPPAVAVLVVEGRGAGYTSRPRATRTATSTMLTAVTASPHHGRPVAASASPASTNSAI